jgi:hypothetical protein
MLILKLATVTCAFCLAIAMLIEVVALSMAHPQGTFGLLMHRLTWIVVFWNRG